MSPPRPWSYGSWGLWAAPALAVALHRLRREFAFDLVHAHYAVPAGDAVRRVAPGVPLVVSVHGGDVYATDAGAMGAWAVRATLAHARLVLANSAGTARRSAADRCNGRIGNSLGYRQRRRRWIVVVGGLQAAGVADPRPLSL